MLNYCCWKEVISTIHFQEVPHKKSMIMSHDKEECVLYWQYNNKNVYVWYIVHTITLSLKQRWRFPQQTHNIDGQVEGKAWEREGWECRKGLIKDPHRKKPHVLLVPFAGVGTSVCWCAHICVCVCVRERDRDRDIECTYEYMFACKRGEPKKWNL